MPRVASRARAQVAVAQGHQSAMETVTEAHSLALVRNLMRTAVSSIAYLRNIFPERCFKDRSFAGVNVKSLIFSDDIPNAATLMSWLETGVFDALKHKYLKSLILGMYVDPKQPHVMLETYSFEVHYSETGEINLNIVSDTGGKKEPCVQLHTRTQIKSATTCLLRSLIVLSQTLKPLPDTRYVTMKLLYTADTPANYEPPGFMPAPLDTGIQYLGNPVRLNVGRVETPFHALRLRIKTAIDAFDASRVAEQSKNLSSDIDILAKHPLPPSCRVIEDTSSDDSDHGSADREQGRLAPENPAPQRSPPLRELPRESSHTSTNPVPVPGNANNGGGDAELLPVNDASARHSEENAGSEPGDRRGHGSDTRDGQQVNQTSPQEKRDTEKSAASLLARASRNRNQKTTAHEVESRPPSAGSDRSAERPVTRRESQTTENHDISNEVELVFAVDPSTSFSVAEVAMHFPQLSSSVVRGAIQKLVEKCRVQKVSGSPPAYRMVQHTATQEDQHDKTTSDNDEDVNNHNIDEKSSEGGASNEEDSHAEDTPSDHLRERHRDKPLITSELDLQKAILALIEYLSRIAASRTRVASCTLRSNTGYRCVGDAFKRVIDFLVQHNLVTRTRNSRFCSIIGGKKGKDARKRAREVVEKQIAVEEKSGAERALGQERAVRPDDTRPGKRKHAEPTEPIGVDGPAKRSRLRLQRQPDLYESQDRDQNKASIAKRPIFQPSPTE